MREPNSSPSKLAKVLCCDRSNIDGFESESEDEEITNFYLMGRADIRESDESEQVTLEYLLTFTKVYLVQVLLKCVKYEQDHIFEIKALRKDYKFLKKKNDSLQRSCENIHTIINDLENKKNIL